MRRKEDRILLLKLRTGRETINVISAYAPQIGLDVASKRLFWDDLDSLMQEIPIAEKVFLGGDLNGHVGRSRENFESVLGGFGVGERDEA